MAVGGQVQGEVEPGHVGVVERHVGLGGAADPDPLAVQAVHAAGVGAADDAEFGGGAAGGVLGVRVGFAEGEDGAVDQRGTAERGLLVQPLVTGVQVDVGGGARAADADRAGQGGGDGAEGGAGRGCDQDVGRAPGAARAAARSKDGEPDLHHARGPFCTRVVPAILPLGTDSPRTVPDLTILRSSTW